MNVKIWFAAVLAFGIASTTWGQQGTAPKPAASAPTLAATMQVIQKELNAVGRLNFVVHISNADEKGTADYSTQLSNVVADPATCTIRYHMWRKMHGEVVNDEDLSLSLHDVKGVWAMSNDEAIKKVAEQEGTVEEDRKYNYYERFVPPMYMVMVRLPDDDGDDFDFADLKQAQQVGKAMMQAVKLCGGTQEPY